MRAGFARIKTTPGAINIFTPSIYAGHNIDASPAHNPGVVTQQSPVRAVGAKLHRRLSLGWSRSTLRNGSPRRSAGWRRIQLMRRQTRIVFASRRLTDTRAPRPRHSPSTALVALGAGAARRPVLDSLSLVVLWPGSTVLTR